MKKNVLFVLVLLLAVGIVSVFAWPDGNYVYAIPGVSGQMQFWVSGGVDLTASGDTVRQAASYRVSGDRLTVTFKNISVKGLRELSGVTIVFKILSNGDLVDQSGGTTWVRIK
jgi:hypothetical protein